MNYDEFKECILGKIREHAETGAEVTLKPVRKNNGVVLDGLTIMPEGRCIAPTIYINQYYGRYKNGLPIEAVVRIILEENRRYSVDLEIDVDDFLEYDNIKSRIRYRLVNYRMNKELLSGVPHEKFLDLAKIYYYEIRDSRLPSAFCTITGADLERWEITREELDAVASANMKEYEPVRLFTMREMLEILAEGRDIVPEVPESIIPMYILTNESRYFGASCILYDHVFEKLSETFDCDLYVLPSSIHEVIITPAYDDHAQGELGIMVTEINEECVPEYEVLSNRVYYYSREMNELRLL